MAEQPTSGITVGQVLLFSLVAIAVLTAVTAVFAVDRALHVALGPVEEERQALVAERLVAEFEAEVDELRADVLVACGAAPVEEVFDDDDARVQAAREAVAASFAAQILPKSNYLQLRLISADGQGRELVRVERRGDRVHVVGAEELQAKGQRPYVQDALLLGPGEVHVSPLELNREHGRIQEPEVPVLRTATPVVVGGHTLGVVVLNADLSGPLDALRAAALGEGSVRLVNESGGFIVHPVREREFGFERGDTKTFAQEFPGLSSLVGVTEPGAQRFQKSDELLLAQAAPVNLAEGPTLTLVTINRGLGDLADQTTARIAGLVAVVASALAALVAFALGRLLRRPLGQMAAAATRIPTRGSLGLARVRLTELRTLADALERTNGELHRQREARAREEARFRGLVESSPAALLLVDGAGLIRLANRRMVELFGYSEAELVGKPVELLVPEETRADHPALVAGYLAAPARRPMAPERELGGLRKDGSIVPVEIGLSPIDGDGGSLVIAAINDITERKEREAELRRSNMELEQFAHVASHDLQEPLRMVANYTELLSQRYSGQLDERADRYIHFAADGARRMQRLVRDLLSWSRVDSQGADLVPTDSEVVLRRVLRSLQVQIRESGAVVEHGDLPMVLADEVQLAQVIQNLVGNSLKFHRDDVPPRVEIVAVREDGFWRFTVDDNGVGIEPEQAHRLFQMFQRLNRTGRLPGSGIGLALARRIIERHGGAIWYEETGTPGATFHFTLPATEDP